MRFPGSNSVRLAFLLPVFLGVLSFCAQAQQVADHSAQSIRIFVKPKPLANFSLVDQDGKAFTENRLQRKWSFVYFGYLSCPDVCPITMSAVAGVWDLLSESGRSATEYQLVFVSLDPDRDSPEQLGQYVKYFNSEFIGATGTEDQLDVITKLFGVIYAYEDDPADDDKYIVQHTPDLFVVDPDARVVAAFPEPYDGTEIARGFRELMKH